MGQGHKKLVNRYLKYELHKSIYLQHSIIMPTPRKSFFCESIEPYCSEKKIQSSLDINFMVIESPSPTTSQQCCTFSFESITHCIIINNQSNARKHWLITLWSIFSKYFTFLSKMFVSTTRKWLLIDNKLHLITLIFFKLDING